MPARATADRAQDYIVDEDRHTIALTRNLSVTVEQAFALWTEPRHVEQRWDPSGEPLAACSINLCVGGELQFVGVGNNALPFVGRYVEINPPTLLVFEAMGAIGTVTIAPRDGGSRVQIEICAPDAEALRGMLEIGVAVGTAQTLDNLQAYSRPSEGESDR